MLATLDPCQGYEGLMCLDSFEISHTECSNRFKRNSRRYGRCGSCKAQIEIER